MNDNGVLRVRSQFPASETVERLRAATVAAGMEILAAIDHSGAAAQVQMPLRPTQLLVFGNARGGTPLMQKNQEAAIDLPLKALIWEDADGAVWLSYNNPHWLAQRHHLGEPSLHAIEAIASALTSLSARSTSA